ncbi:hypothetical protein CkaCkLH20_04505 [Colletotrichum karsti]|uniref:Uncharacterized protein n=1 Tax=Colletotrichum karsti TaxID=1095194 RepID=A0A9P6I8I6_9PEZI|nr:uncharacterized protein CkaCkLH20_04505 [Colletotrichum karsti]KAF9877929.1 hypothetical protein CkaCkLH20_04505 [Colletotrichum karsti]
MNPSTASDDGDLAESSYEFINTDDDLESQDDRATEATEAESLSSFDYARPDDVHSLDGIERTDTEDEDEDDEDDVAEDRSRASSIQYAEQSLMNPSSRVATPPLDHASFFETQSPICVKPVEVKHVTHHFSEPNPRQISSISVRRTMAQSSLDVKGPFRILYNGDSAAEHEIIQKFSSALAASTSQEHFLANSLSVQYYDAEDVSVPHVAVFYITKDDDETSQSIREAAWTTMHERAVPCVFVSDTELFQQLTENWNDRIDPHVIHQFVEFSDPELEPLRLPIDLKSFKEIDARQLNYNLAYLTGLSKTAVELETSRYADLYGHSMKMVRNYARYLAPKLEDFDVWTAVQYSVISGIVFAALLLGNWHMGGSSSIVPAVSTTTPAPPMSTTPVAVSTSTVIINLTSSTVRAPQLKTTHSSAVAPFAELADFFADKLPESQKGFVCSAEKYSHNEILVKIPSGTKTSWLAKDSISIRALKGDRSVKTKLSSTDEGILIEIPKREAHGVLTITVNTTRKPKVNETFSIDFGKTILGQCFGYGKSVANVFQDAAHRGVEQVIALGSLKTSVVDDIREMSTRISEDAAKTANYVKTSWNPAALAATWQGLRHSRQTKDTLDWLDIKHKTAQIQSRLWWLKISQQAEKYDNYLMKAKKYLSDKKATAEKSSKERFDRERMELRARRKQERLEARCQSGFSRWTQQCKQQA